MTARKSLLSLAAALALGCLVSCGDSTGGSGGSNSGSATNGSYKESIKVDGDTIRYTAEITIKVLSHDAEAHEFVLENAHRSYCVRDGESVNWQTVREDEDSARVTYRFETLSEEAVATLERNGNTVKNGVALVVDDGEDELVFVGRDSSSVFGEWQSALCGTSVSRGISCEEDPYTGSVLKISKNSVTDVEKFLAKKSNYIYDDPFGTYFAALLYEQLLAPGHAYTYPALTMFYEDTNGVAGAIEDADVEIKEQTSKSQTFAIGGKTYSVKILKRDWAFHGSDIEYSFDVEVAGESETCRITARSISGVDKEFCADKYMDNYEWDDDEDVDGNEYEYADGIEWNNDDEYLPCLERIAGSSAAPAVAKAARRTAAAKKVPVLPAKKRLFVR